MEGRQFNFCYTKQDYFDFLAYHSEERHQGTRNKWWCRVTAAVAALFLVLLVYVGSGARPQPGLGYVAFLVGAGIWLALTLLVSFLLNRGHNARVLDGYNLAFYTEGTDEWLRPRRLAYGPAALTLDSFAPGARGHLHARYGAVARIAQGPTALYLRLNDSTVLVLPLRLLEPDGIESCRRFLEEKRAADPVEPVTLPPAAPSSAVLSLDFTCSRQDLAGWMLYLGSRSSAPAFRRFYRLLLGLACFFLAILFIYSSERIQGVGVILAIIGVLCCWLASKKSQTEIIYKRAESYTKQKLRDFWYNPRRLAFGEEGLVDERFGSGLYTRHELDCASLALVEEVYGLFFLTAVDGVVTAVPSAALGSEERRAWLHAFLEERRTRAVARMAGG